LTISLWNVDGNSAQTIAEVAGGCDLLKGDVAPSFHRPNPFARDPPELLDGSAPCSTVSLSKDINAIMLLPCFWLIISIAQLPKH
jgi:hypothetical protein